VRAGIRALWNFTPVRIQTPDHVVVQNTSMYAHLALMFTRMKVLQESQSATPSSKPRSSR
jgi:redox-sensing transcriptional repressor rex